jgi:hypothetical protein
VHVVERPESWFRRVRALVFGDVLVHKTVSVRSGHLQEVVVTKEGKRKQESEGGVGAVEGVVPSTEDAQELPMDAQRLRMEEGQPGYVELPMPGGVEWRIERNVDQEARRSAKGDVLESNGEHRGGLRGSRK